MAFDTSTSDQRVELLRQAEKTANLTRRVTIGSGVMDDAAKSQGDALCGMLESALAAIGYGELPPGTVTVTGGEAKPVLALGGTPLVTGSTLVGDDVFEGIEIPETASIVENADLVQVREFDKTSIVSSNCVAEVSANGLSYVSLPAGTAVAANGGTVPGGVVNSAGADTHPATFTVTDGKITNVKITAATTGLVDQGDTVSVQNSAGANGIGSTAQVANGVITAVRLPAASAAVSNGAALTVPVTGAYTTTATIAVANGVITGITLS